MAKKKSKTEKNNPFERVNGLFLKKPAVPFKMTGTRAEKKRLIEMINTVANASPFAKDVLDNAAKNGYTLCFKNQHGSVGNTNGGLKEISLLPSASDDKLASTLIHEARHAGQIANGADFQFFSLNVKSEILVRRAMEADACACAALGVMQMKENGFAAAYDAYKKDSPELFAALETAGQNNASPDELLKTGFDCWYKDTRTKAAYENVYLTNPMKKANYDGFYFMMDFYKDVKSADVIDKICVGTQGNRYFADKNALDDMKYLDISERTKEVADEFFKERESYQFQKPDTSYQSLPVRESTIGESLTLFMNGFGELNKAQTAEKKGKILENKDRFKKALVEAKKPLNAAQIAVAKNKRGR